MYKLRKNRRIIALAMVFVMMFTFMAVTASAATTRATCPRCGSGDTVTGSRSTITGREEVYYCDKMAIGHEHVTYHVVDFSRCRSCGFEDKIDEYDWIACE